MSDPERGLEWRAYWLRAVARRSPARLVLAGGLWLAALAVAVLTLPILAATALLVVAVLALDAILLPVTYRLGEQGVRIRTVLRSRQLAWTEVREARPSPYGVVLWLSAGTSVHLLAPGREAAVTAYVAARTGGASAATSGST